jgi:hypothetical protein
MYGKLLSAPINVKPENWPKGTPTSGNDAYPQFATDKGQQIGIKLFGYGTYGTNGTAKGYLGNIYDQNNHYGTPGPMLFYPQVTAVGDYWAQSLESFTPSDPSVVTATPRAVLVAKVTALLGQITDLMKGLN